MKNFDRSSNVINELLELIKTAGEIREWTEWAACRSRQDVNFFPSFPIIRPGGGTNTASIIKRQQLIAQEAIKICQTCPVIEQCKRDHLHEEDGIFFGTTPYERIGPVRRSKHWRSCKCIPCRNRRLGNRNFGGK